MQEQLKIVDFKPEYTKDFYAITIEWVDGMFGIEDVDRYYIEHPQENIIDKGGSIYFVEHKNELIGTAALVWCDEPGTIELIKMGVYQKARGLKAGQILMDESIRRGKEMGAKKMYLETHSSCVAAIHMYRKAGFVDAPVHEGCEYERCNLAMELVL
ncbi:MAG: GNAT family N-acetyltransferase [Gammaproteobacteria bacterium]|nr:GNAT family N-acetyltransferase [Gammaproteobacteria bacterium]NNC97062.1 GNAT family N-acetyltransferase [Gammaproteobacteria bacterium]NNM14342.1 GNAT family N-acetyltransferase [Gammaproteobacteria bacterium]